VLNDYDATMINHQPRPALPQAKVCHATSRTSIFQQLKIYPGKLRRFHAGIGTGACASRSRERQGQRPDFRPAGIRAAVLGQRFQGAAGPRRASVLLEKIKNRGSQAVARQNPYIPSSRPRNSTARLSGVRKLRFRYPNAGTSERAQQRQLSSVEAGRAHCHNRFTNGIGKTTLMRCSPAT